MSQGEKLTRWVRESPGAGGHQRLCPHPAGPDRGPWPLGPLCGSAHRATRLQWARWGSQLIVVTRQVLAVVGGLAAHKHVPVVQDLSLAQTPVLGAGAGGVRGQQNATGALPGRLLPGAKYGSHGLCSPLSGSPSPWVPVPLSLGLCSCFSPSPPRSLCPSFFLQPNRDPRAPGACFGHFCPPGQRHPLRPCTWSVSLSCSKWLASTSGWSWAGGSTQWPTSLPSSCPSLFRSRKSRNCSRSVRTQAGSSSPASAEYRSAGVGGERGRYQGQFPGPPSLALTLLDPGTSDHPLHFPSPQFPLLLNGIDNKPDLQVIIMLHVKLTSLIGQLID